MTPLEAALHYIEGGHHRVVPIWDVLMGGCGCGLPDCASPAKHPIGQLVPRGLLDATTDPEKIRTWWAAFPRANVAIRTGGDFFVLDIDPQRGGDDTLGRLEEINGPLPPTREALTGGGGRHLHFATRNGQKIRSAANVLGPGVDVRGEGGYIVVPPSTHLSGRSYEWEASTVDERRRPAVAPAWLIDALTMPPRAAARPDDAPAGDSKIPQGARNDTLARMAGTLRRRGLSADAIAAALKVENAARCDPPLSEREVDAIARSIGRYEPADPVRPGPSLEEQERAAIMAEGSSAIRSVSLLDLQENPPLPVRWLVENLIPERSLCLLFGKPFGGKSLFALQLGLHAAGGITFLPSPDGSTAFKFPRPLRVLYLDEEMGLALIFKRTALMKSGPREQLRVPEALARFRVLSRLGFRIDEPKSLEALRREIDDFPGGRPDLLIVDTLRRVHAGEEKESDTMARLTATLIEEQERAGFASLVLHHSKKGAEDENGDWREAARGSGDLVAACQSVVAVWKTGELFFSMRADAKAAGEIQPFPLALDPQTLLFHRPTDEERAMTRDEQHESAIAEAKAGLCRALRKIKDSPLDYPPSWARWFSKVRGNRNTLTEARDRLIAEGAVLETPRAGRGGGKGYILPEDALETA
jgi:Bifunctional DNA primase/polymerase, N-terminal/AAA domain/Primase C terminal 1 (PriCT-1)